MTTFCTTFESPVGPLQLMSDGQSLTGLHTDSDKHRPAMRPDWIRDDAAAPFAEVKAQLRAYFDGRLTEFDLPLAPQGTEFQLRTWRELRGIPYGETISYGELARRIGNPNAAVFPVPVRAWPRMSWPASAGGISCRWISLGSTNCIR